MSAKYQRYQRAAARLNSEAGNITKCYTKMRGSITFTPCAKADVYIAHSKTLSSPGERVTTEAATTPCACHGNSWEFGRMLAYEFETDA